MIPLLYVLIAMFSIPLGFIGAQGVCNFRDYLRKRRGK